MQTGPEEDLKITVIEKRLNNNVIMFHSIAQ